MSLDPRPPARPPRASGPTPREDDPRAALDRLGIERREDAEQRRRSAAAWAMPATVARPRGTRWLGPLIAVGAVVSSALLLLTAAGLMLLTPGGQSLLGGQGCDTSLSGGGIGPDGAPVPPGGDPGSLNPVQQQHAATIVGVGKAMNIPPRGWIVALATAMQESRMGLAGMDVAVDHDSLGLFQQRPSTGWGSPAQVRDPIYASSKFYDALLAVPDWAQMPVTVAAQTVQSSAFPSAYAKWQGMAASLAQGLAQTPPIPPPSAGAPGAAADIQAASTGGAGATTECAPAAPGAPVAPGAASPAAATVIQAGRAELGKPYQWGATGPDTFDCSGLMLTAFRAGGVTLPRTSREQYGAGTHIPVEQAQPGDMVFFAYNPDNPATIHHVGLYLGNGQMLEAPQTGTPVRERAIQLQAGADELMPFATRPGRST